MFISEPLVTCGTMLSALEGHNDRLLRNPEVSFSPKSTLSNVDNRSHTKAHFEFLKINGWTSQFKSVDVLLRSLKRKSRSEETKDTYARQIYNFCMKMNRDPDELIHLSKSRAETIIQKYADDISDHSRSSANQIVSALNALYFYNGFKKSRELDLEGYGGKARTRVTEEYIPQKHEIYQMSQCAGSLRNSTMILCLFSSGLRNSTLRALLVRDVIDQLRAGIENVMLPVYVGMRRWIPSACKGAIEYFTFICEEATRTMKLYIEERERIFGELLGEEPLFFSNYNQIARHERSLKFLTSAELVYVVKESAKRAGIAKWNLVHPHSLRKAYETVLHGQRYDGSVLSEKIQSYFMGHILPGSQDVYLDKTKVESYRYDYSQLQFNRAVVDEKFKVLKSAAQRAFAGSGIDAEQVILEYARMKSSVANSH